MDLSHLLGFAASDFIELFLTLVFVGLALAWRPWIEPYGRRLAQKTGWCMLLLALLPIALRLALLPQYPIPTPNVSDDFSYLLSADTLRHFRLANPVHPLHQFFETFFVLQQPAYQSIFPPGQGLILAIGWTIFGHPWAGVALSIGALCALCYWMLRAWVSPGWALVGGLARGHRVRTAQSMDEQLLGRRCFGVRGLPGVWIAAPAAYQRERALCDFIGPGDRSAIPHSSL